MTDRQFKTITKKLHFYNQGGIKNLCTMTETTLRQVMEEAAGVTQAYIRKLVQHDVDQQNKIAFLSAKVYKLEKENAELKRDKEDLIFIRNQNAKCMCEDKENLTKAKKIIKSLLRLWNDVMTEETVKALVTEAEQFLKDQEEINEDLDDELQQSNECHDCAKFDEMPKGPRCKTCDNGSHFQKKEEV